MLEDRLSKAYSQHSIGGYSLPQSAVASSRHLVPGPYPVIQPSQNQQPPQTSLDPSTGIAENYYTTGQTSDIGGAPSDPYNAQGQQTPRPQFTQRNSVVGSPQVQYVPAPVKRTGSWQAVPVPSAPGPYPTSTPNDRQPPQQQQPQQATQSPHQQPQPQAPVVQAPPPQPSQPASDDASASLYYVSPQKMPQQALQPPPTMAAASSQGPYPSLNQPAPNAFTQQQAAQPQATPVQSPRQPYWASTSHQAVQPSQKAWQGAPDQTYQGYANNVQPPRPQPVVEESLIEL